VPVICGIGHDKDVPLASLASDVMVSTPTAVTRELNSSWERLVARVDILERDLLSAFERELTDKKNTFHRNVQSIATAFADIVQRCRGVEERVRHCLSTFQFSLSEVKKKMDADKKALTVGFNRLILRVVEKLDVSERTIFQSDPRRQLKLGYSIISSAGRVVRSVGDVARGDDLLLLVRDGKITAKVEGVFKQRNR
jgi:exodeoxyribonuclease VII large subunit